MSACPACSKPGTKILMGLFPVWICEDGECSCVWGFWSLLACLVTPIFYPPSDCGFAFPVVSGGYLRSVFRLVCGGAK